MEVIGMRAFMHRVGSLALAGLLPGSALAGTVVQQLEFEPGKTEARQQTTVYLEGGKMRVEGVNASSKKFVVIFDETEQVTWMIDPDKGSYMEFTAADVERMASQMHGMATQMQEMMKQMEAQMANMPPEQRAMMEQMMRGRMAGMAGGGMPAPATKTVRQKAAGETVGQFTCTRYEILADGELTQEVCAAPADALQLDASAMETFKALGKFYEPLTRVASSFSGDWAAPTAMDQIEGFPVQTIIYKEGKATSEWRVEQAETRALEAGLFELPDGLKKTEIPQAPQMPTGR
jgi:hypothetical protein